MIILNGYNDNLYQLSIKNTAILFSKERRSSALTYREQIAHLIDYVEENLHDTISIRDAAKRAMMSVPHLYRIFPLITGCTVGAYIRKRRLSLSAVDLADTGLRIIDIAAQYGYDSQESYIRAFNQMFGTTPGRYRTTKEAIALYPKFGFPQLKEENMSIRYTDADRDACLPIIDIMVNCAKNARSHGITNSEDFILRQKNDFLTYLMTLVIDGAAPTLVKGMGETLLKYSGYDRNEELERIIIIEGALSIQAGEHPYIIRAKLLTFLGEPYLKKKGFFPIDSWITADKHVQ